MPRLVIEDGAGRREVPLSEGRLRVGRGPDGNGLRLEERNVSRTHAAFETQGGAVWVEDLDSRNGTFVNGERLNGRRRVRAGDRVRVGAFELLLENGTGELALSHEPTVERPLPPPLPTRHTPRQDGEPAPAPRPPATATSTLRRAAAAAARAVEAVVDKARGK